ncbi:hypothetical protein [Roseiflexus sp.]
MSNGIPQTSRYVVRRPGVPAHQEKLSPALLPRKWYNIPYDALSAKTPMPNLALPHRDVDVWLITLTLPDDLAREAEAHGLLTPMAS